MSEQSACAECGGSGRVILEEIQGHVAHWRRCWVCRPVPPIESDGARMHALETALVEIVDAVLIAPFASTDLVTKAQDVRKRFL